MEIRKRSSRLGMPKEFYTDPVVEAKDREFAGKECPSRHMSMSLLMLGHLCWPFEDVRKNNPGKSLAQPLAGYFLTG